MTTETSSFHHISVLSDELISSLPLQNGSYVIDCTAGGGGHSAKILDKILPDGKLLALDQDPEAIAHLTKKFETAIQNGSFILEEATFSELEPLARKHGFLNKTCGIIADIGVSSHQLNCGDRGFSFMHDGPLNMRMDKDTEELTAEKLVNEFPTEEIIKILYKYGEERQAPRVARAIVRNREKSPIKTTGELAEIIKNSLPYKGSKKHPATKTFQALRIFLNKELEELETLLDTFLDVLTPSGRAGIITFHSLEDRLVKTSFLKLSGRDKRNDIPREIPLTQEEITSYNQVKAKVIKPFPGKPSADELAENPRSRSAKLRVIEKL